MRKNDNSEDSNINLQIAITNLKKFYIPKKTEFKHWINLVLKDQQRKGEITIRIVDEDESQQLNAHYRHKNKSTNVLAFPYSDIDNYLGDLVICANVVAFEAKQQEKIIQKHWAHLVIHGCLHLLGYDHIELAQAKEMEALEIAYLKQLNIENPYEEE